MDRRKYLKTFAVGALGAGVLVQGCDTEQKQEQAVPETKSQGPDRQPEETRRYEDITREKFFDPHEMATIAVLADIIIPKDEVSGSASDAGVPAFIEFIVKDKPQLQTPLRGGLRWLDVQCMRRYSNAFQFCSSSQQIELIDEIAYPEKAKSEMQPGVSFFNLMRDLTATGFFTSEIGMKDLGYKGNSPNQWNGVPQEVLQQYGLKYDERTLQESVKFDS